MNMREAKIISNYANYVVKNNRKQLNKTDWNIIGANLKTTTKLRPYLTRKIVMSNIELANNKILDILSRNGIDVDKPLKIYNEAYEIAKSKENSKDLISIADRYVDLLSLKPKQEQIQTQTETISFNKMLETGETAKVTATREVKNLENREKTRVNTIIDPENSEKIDNSSTDNGSQAI
jgi:hypothetical protein